MRCKLGPDDYNMAQISASVSTTSARWRSSQKQHRADYNVKCLGRLQRALTTRRRKQDRHRLRRTGPGPIIHPYEEIGDVNSLVSSKASICELNELAAKIEGKKGHSEAGLDRRIQYPVM